MSQNEVCNNQVITRKDLGSFIFGNLSCFEYNQLFWDKILL